MDRNLLLAIVLSVLIIVGFQFFFQSFTTPTPVSAPSKTEQPQKAAKVEPLAVEKIQPARETTRSESEIKSTGNTATNEGKSVSAAEPIEESKIKIESPIYEAIVTNIGGKIVSFKLKGFRKTINGPELVNLVPPESGDTSAPSIRLTGSDEVFSDANLGYSYETKDTDINLSKPDDQKTIIFRGVSPSGLILIKKFTFYAEKYRVDLSYAFENPSNQSKDYLITFPLKKHFADDSMQFSWNSVEVLLDGVLKDYYFRDIKGDEELSGLVEWAGLGEAHFLKALIFSQRPAAKVTLLKPSTIDIAEILVRYGSIEIPVGGKSPETRLGFYLGPKQSDDLKVAGGNLGRALVYSNYQVLNIMSVYLMDFLRFTYSGFSLMGLKIPGTGNYGLGIIILTLLIKILFIPLTHKSMKSMKRMQDLQPEIAKLKEKFKDDKSSLNKATMELFRDNKVNPLGSCWPMFLQIPVFIALYQALSYAIELRHAPFVCIPSIYLCIQDLSAPDPYYVTPILMGGTMVLQQWMTPSAGDPMQKKMMLLMPVVFTYMFLSFPAGLVLYWLVSNILSIGQQLLTNRLSQ
jgi:YidC/Oxa1 family membrane protein insertase